MIKLLFTIIFLCTSSITLALDIPKCSNLDSRVQYVNYNEDNVVEINTYSGLSTQVAFSPGEEILDVAAGFSDGWWFSSRRNNLYLKAKSVKGKNDIDVQPISGVWDTNLQVTTNLRTYAFQIALLPKDDGSKIKNSLKAAYIIKFRYPAEEAAKAQQAADQLAAEKQLTSNPIPQNWNYAMQIGKDSEGIAPSMAYDDGRFTYFKFPGNREFPAVFVVAADKTESLVNSHIDPKIPDVLVVQRVAPEMALRLGNQVIGIFNENYDAYGIATQNGTTVRGIKRTIRTTMPTGATS